MVALFLLLAGTGWAKEGVDDKNKIINIAGYDACTGKYGDYGSGNKKGSGTGC